MSNPYRLIKQLAILTGVFMVAATSVRAQQSSYYIYIQSDNGQPFYTQIGDKVYSSSNVGHVIIAGVKDNVCNLEIGFPQHASRPQQFSIPVKGKDHGYQLRKNGSNDWALYNWQNQETIKPQKGAGTSNLLYGERKKDDAFAALMAAVVNDSAVLYTSIVKNDAPESPVVAKTTKKEEKKSADTLATAVASLTVPVADTAKAADKPLYDSSALVAKNDKPLADTPKVFKNDKPLFDTTARAVYKNDKPLFDTTTAAAKPYKADKPLYDTTAGLKVDSVMAVAEKKADEPVAKAPKVDKKASKPGVVKVQETKDKEGETKLVFIDSSESPAAVVTAYIPEEKPAQPATPPAATGPVTASTVKTEEKKADNDKKAESGNTEIVTVKPEEKKEAPKPPVVSPVSTATEMPKQGGLKIVAERPAERKGDTLTIILESPQQQLRRDTAKLQKQEAPKPLYENKQVTQPVVETQNNLGVVDKQEEAKTEPVKTEPAKTEPVKSEPVAVKKDTVVAKAEMPKPVVETKTAEPEKKKLVMINSDCAGFATDADVDKLRVKMIAENDVAKRVAVANKLFKTRCLTAKQMKALSELFPTDETKYNFLSMAYPFAADTENFKELYQLFGDESYQTRFKTLVRY